MFGENALDGFGERAAPDPKPRSGKLTLIKDLTGVLHVKVMIKKETRSSERRRRRVIMGSTKFWHIHNDIGSLLTLINQGAHSSAATHKNVHPSV